MKNFMILLAASTLLLLSSCSGEGRNWQKAKTRNTVRDFEQLMAAYPQSAFTDSAKNKILEQQILPDFFKEGQTSAGVLVTP